VRFVVDLDNVAAYTPGAHAETVMRDFALERVVKLASNEYPLPPVAGVRERIVAAIDDLNRYPDTYAAALRGALADHHRFPVERVAIGNGSLELLLLLGSALLAPGVEAVIPEPSFALYRTLCDTHGAATCAVALRDHGLDLDAMAAAVTPATSLIILCNPNNPTGTYVTAAAIARFVARVPRDVLVVVDEAYNEFVTAPDRDEVVALAREHDNLCVTRTFSKIYGLCGLRVGYALCSPEVRAAIDVLRQPFNVNLLAQVAAAEALRHQGEVERRRGLNAALRGRLTVGLEALGLRVVPSEANFVFVCLDGLTVPAGEVCERLMALGVILRDGTAFGQPGWARVSVGTRDEIDFFLERLASLAPADGERPGR